MGTKIKKHAKIRLYEGALSYHTRSCSYATAAIFAPEGRGNEEGAFLD